jgi:hypothetical protein
MCAALLFLEREPQRSRNTNGLQAKTFERFDYLPSAASVILREAQRSRSDLSANEGL